VDPEWSNTTVVALDEVASLKERHEGDVLVAGSASLARALVEDGLADELRLLVYPVALGTGKRLFGEGGKQDLRLARSEAYSSGVVNLTYRR
jgi:dihydrofolate reductase